MSTNSSKIGASIRNQKQSEVSDLSPQTEEDKKNGHMMSTPLKKGTTPFSISGFNNLNNSISNNCNAGGILSANGQAVVNSIKKANSSIRIPIPSKTL